MKTLSDLATSTFHTATYSKDQRTTGINVCPENGRLILFFNALFHLCQITLHSLIVPLFSGTSVEESICRETVRKSAERVVNHAQSFESLLAPYLYTNVDATHLPPLVGYGAFITAMVFLATEVSCRSKTSLEVVTGIYKRSGKLSSVEAILSLLDTLQRYWKPLQHPVSEGPVSKKKKKKKKKTYNLLTIPGVQYEKLRAALQLNFSTCEAAASRGDTLANHSIRSPDRRFLEHIQRSPIPGQMNYTDGGLGSARERGTQFTRPSYDMHPDRERSRSRVVTNSMAEHTGDALNQADPGRSDGSFMEDAWYSLSFAEAGIEEFAGYEPLFLFQQGCSTFS